MNIALMRQNNFGWIAVKWPQTNQVFRPVCLIGIDEAVELGKMGMMAINEDQSVLWGEDIQDDIKFTLTQMPFDKTLWFLTANDTMRISKMHVREAALMQGLPEVVIAGEDTPADVLPYVARLEELEKLTGDERSVAEEEINKIRLYLNEGVAGPVEYGNEHWF